MTIETDQAELLRKAKAKLKLTSEELALRLGVSPHTVKSWLLPSTLKAHRPMPETAKILLRYVVKFPNAFKRAKGEK